MKRLLPRNPLLLWLACFGVLTAVNYGAYLAAVAHAFSFRRFTPTHPAAVLRHTALRKMAEKKGIRYARQMAGHASNKYIWRYVQPSRIEMEAAVEELFD
jgi:hypothetical protein